MECRSDWTRDEIRAVHDSSLLELIFRAASLTRSHHQTHQVQVCSLISIKTGGCPEDCKYCSQSSRYQTNVTAAPLMSEEEIVAMAKNAVRRGPTRICLGAAWRSVESRLFSRWLEAYGREILP